MKLFLSLFHSKLTHVFEPYKKLHKKIEKRKPKKSFSLKKRSAPKPKVPVSEPVLEVPPVDQESKVKLVPIISNVSNETINYKAENRDASLLIKSVAECTIRISGACSSLTLENASNTTLVMENVTFGAAMVRDCTDCEVTLTSRQLRIRNCHKTTFNVAVCSKIALEESTHLIFKRHPNEKVDFKIRSLC